MDLPIGAPKIEDESRPEPHDFDDDYWDDMFNTLYDPCMRVCSVFGC